MKQDKEYIEVRVQDLRRLRAAVERNDYYQTEDEKKQSGASLLGFIDGWIAGLFTSNDL